MVVNKNENIGLTLQLIKSDGVNVEEQSPLCKCGCGKEVRWNSRYKRWNTFIFYHNQKGENNSFYGKKHTDKTKAKISIAQFGENNGMYDKKHTAETKQKISDNHADISGENNGMYDKKHTVETKQKISDSCPYRGGENNSFYGKKHSEESKKKMSIAQSGEKSHAWKGGISCEPYCDVWRDKEYKQSIKDRDNNECQNPNCWGKSKRLVIHHIDYDKKNCVPKNLITLCNSCNVRANTNKEQWQELYEEIMVDK